MNQQEEVIGVLELGHCRKNQLKAEKFPSSGKEGDSLSLGTT